MTQKTFPIGWHKKGQVNDMLYHNHKGDPITMVIREPYKDSFIWIIDGGLGRRRYWAWHPRGEAMAMYRAEYQAKLMEERASKMHNTKR